jgi:hypothetical protein
VIATRTAWRFSAKLLVGSEPLVDPSSAAEQAGVHSVSPLQNGIFCRHFQDFFKNVHFFERRVDCVFRGMASRHAVQTEVAARCIPLD